jgi:hypothetical protein
MPRADRLAEPLREPPFLLVHPRDGIQWRFSRLTHILLDILVAIQAHDE